MVTMSLPLDKKIEQLKARYQGDTSLPPHEALAIVDALRLMLEIEQSRITAIAEAQIRLDGRMHQLERVVATCKEPRG
jgi:hypothetical protein